MEITRKAHRPIIERINAVWGEEGNLINQSSYDSPEVILDIARFHKLGYIQDVDRIKRAIVKVFGDWKPFLAQVLAEWPESDRTSKQAIFAELSWLHADPPAPNAKLLKRIDDARRERRAALRSLSKKKLVLQKQYRMLIDMPNRMKQEMELLAGLTAVNQELMALVNTRNFKPEESPIN